MFYNIYALKKVNVEHIDFFQNYLWSIFQ